MTIPAPLSPVPVASSPAAIPLPNGNTVPPAPAISSEKQRPAPACEGNLTPVDNQQQQRLWGDIDRPSVAPVPTPE